MDACKEVIKKNLGLSRCQMPSAIKGMITVPHGTSFTPEDFVDKTFWNSKMLAAIGARCYFWPTFRGVEDQSEEAIYEQNAYGSMAVRDGQYRWRIQIKESMCLHAAMFTHRSNGDVDVILIDMENNWLATVGDDALIYGYSVDLLHTEKLKFSDGSVSTKSPIYLCLKDNLEIDRSGVMYNNKFMNQLYRIIDIKLDVLDTSTVDELDVQVSTVCSGDPVPGLLTADFLVTKPDGTVNGGAYVSTPDPNVSGLYHIAKAVATPFVSGNITTRAAANLTVKPYETPNPTAFVVA